MEPKWWHRDPITKEIVVDKVFDTTEYPITTACFVMDWCMEGEWTPKARFGYIAFGYEFLRSVELVANHPWRIK